ncbi:extracellular matrix-binding ebh [Babesia caballi]|uniref:Extracellular matrix-binding ebh n=1 Tax=Babesia caballi TaxID=5871 RepID=A0AAV4LLU8_BABCB|nr:extracellular matrix-binding ebh [Babesia caballi]
MAGQGYKSSELNSLSMGSDVIGKPFANLQDFSEAMNTAKQAAQERSAKEETARTTLGIGKPFAPDPRTGETTKPVSVNNKPTYPEYLHELCGKWCKEPFIFTPSDDKPLSALYYVSYLYFKGKQSALSADSNFKPRPPSTIREMLYFLAALPFSPSYDRLNSHISSNFRTLVPNRNPGVKDFREDFELMIPVADSASYNTNNTISAAEIKDYLITTCLYCPSILGTIQGNAGSGNSNEPWLHELYSNGLALTYPSGSMLFQKLSAYSYALQFQLYFLYMQCSNGNVDSGWSRCRYGSNVPAHDKSHICPAPCKSISDLNCRHDGSNANTPKCQHFQQCGKQNDVGSPLQAFLTDKLKGFSRGHPSGHSYHLAACSGTMCHVPMGFKNHIRPKSRMGNYVYSALHTFCSVTDTPLRQLSEKLGCLTKRTPRTLGDVFGFIWQLNGQLFREKRPKVTDMMAKFDSAFELGSTLTTEFQKNRHSAIGKLWKKIAELSSQKSQPTTTTVLSKSLEYMAPIIPFLYQFFMMEESQFLPGALFDLVQHCHKWDSDQYKHESVDHTSSIPGHKCSEHAADLWCLYHPISPAPGGSNTDPYKTCRAKNCGGYLEPLTLTDGTAFSPSAAPAYLSWMAYLTDDLYERLDDILEAFKNINCNDCNSKFVCTKGNDGKSVCSCPCVVSCSGVLPLLYRHGCQFNDAFLLNGWKWDYGAGKWAKDAPSVRSCEKFERVLSNVLSPNAPLAKLLESIDNFLYLFRFYFFYNLSSFWLCSFLILLYFIFYGIDVLHLQSHAHFPSSHGIPSIGLLTTGKAPALTKLTYYMP